MQGKYDNNPIFDLYSIMHNELLHHTIPEAAIIEREYEEVDDIFKLILLNNGCKISKHNTPKQTTVDIIDDEYRLCFITNMLGNDSNEYYDFIIFNGMKYLIIFLEYFDILTEEEYNKFYNDNNNPAGQFKAMVGNSPYYDSIKKIVEVFYLTSEPMPGGLLTTAMATTQRWNQAIIAIHILNVYKPVDENDVSDIHMEDIKKILDGNIELQLYGIRTM
jgi:hypothetical protein